MELNKQVVSLELAKRLKEVGVKQESLFSYLRYDDGHQELIYGNAPKGNSYWTSAFTVAELGEMLPNEIRSMNPNTRREETYHLHYWHIKEGWYLEYSTRGRASSMRDNSHCAHWEENSNEADARAQMIIYLLEQKLITL